MLPFLKTLRKTVFLPIQQMAIRGDSDFILCVNGRFVALELKTDEGKEAPLQKYKREQVMLAHGLAFVVTPTNWEKIKKYLTSLSEGTPYV